MSQVFISYRQTNAEQRERVRVFGESLRRCGIDVVLDQFFLDANPGGPNDGWPKWSSDRALETEFVLIVGTEAWFQCFENKQKPGTGLGAACEADDLRLRIYEAGGVIPNIRVVLFDEADKAHIPGKLRPYHRFNAERDFENIVRWLGGKIPSATNDSPRTSIPHNLPSLQPFYGREGELRKIAEALDPESRTWGALIDGPGGMGKTSLAVRAAYDASPEHFEKIVFVSLKPRELDDDGVRDLSGFLISGLAELLNELARELGHAEIAKASEDQRPRLLLDALRGTRTLIVLDNLESLIKPDRNIVFTFVKKLPPGCKAILTARGRIGSAAEELILEKLSEQAALATLAELAERNSTLAKTNESDRRVLYRETGGSPLLLRWTAGQIGRGSCLTFSDAIAYLRSCPEGNDPLEFIFGDLVEGFSEAETRILCALTYFTLPAKVGHLSELAECTEADADHALRSLVNRSLVVPSDELKSFALVPLVADFLLKKKPGVMEETGDRLEQRVYALVVQNGYSHHDRYRVLDVAWPTVAAALPRFRAGPNERLQTVCLALAQFLEFTGRWDEGLALANDAERRGELAKDFLDAANGAYNAGWIHILRNQSAEVLTAAARAEAHWHKAQADPHKKRALLKLRGLGYYLAGDYKLAIAAQHESLELRRSLGAESEDVASDLNELAAAEFRSGEIDAAERDFREALMIARACSDTEGIAIYSGNLAELKASRQDWVDVETLAREALSLSETIGRLDLIASNAGRLANSLVGQGRSTEAVSHARRAVDILTRLGSPELEAARITLASCEPQ